MVLLIVAALLVPAGLKIGGVKPFCNWKWVWALSPVWIASILGVVGVILIIPIFKWIKNMLFPKPVFVTAPSYAPMSSPPYYQPVGTPTLSPVPHYRQARYFPARDSHTGRNLLVIAALLSSIFAVWSEKGNNILKQGIKVISTIAMN